MHDGFSTLKTITHTIAKAGEQSHTYSIVSVRSVMIYIILVHPSTPTDFSIGQDLTPLLAQWGEIVSLKLYPHVQSVQLVLQERVL